jgi:4-hydroxybenzoate polyprenyltransferase
VEEREYDDHDGIPVLIKPTNYEWLRMLRIIRIFAAFAAIRNSLDSFVSLLRVRKTYPLVRLDRAGIRNCYGDLRAACELCDPDVFVHDSGVSFFKSLHHAQLEIQDQKPLDQSRLRRVVAEFGSFAVCHFLFFVRLMGTLAKSSKVSSYMSLVVFSHTIFAMPFAIIGYLLAVKIGGAVFSWKLFGLVIGCMVFARSAAMGFNRYIDREFDANNERTASREIPAGVISPVAAISFVIVNCLLFMAATWFINRTCFYLSPVALAVVLGYSYTKRFTALCHVILGIGLSLAPIGAWLAGTDEFAWLPLFYSFAVIFWVGGFDMIYALQDETFDRNNKLRSMPAWLGKKSALRVSEIFHVISAFFIWFAGYYAHFGWIYYSGAAIYSGLLVYQHSIVRPDDLSRVNRAFGTTNGIASVIFAVFVALELFFGK